MPSIVRLAEVAAYLDELLRVADYDEGEPSNGLMLDAARPVTRIAAAVNTSFRSIEGAAAAGAELLLVHHTTWASIDLQLKERKEEALRAVGVSLYGAHAALDRHDELSPSVVLARRCSCRKTPVSCSDGPRARRAHHPAEDLPIVRIGNRSGRRGLPAK
jgi:putative NIF3 family GTP cyclohydrolase 1 type 2